MRKPLRRAGRMKRREGRTSHGGAVGCFRVWACLPASDSHRRPPRPAPRRRRAALRAQPYDDVLMEQVAEQAGFPGPALPSLPSKHALFAAVYQQAADRLLAETRLDLTAPWRSSSPRGWTSISTTSSPTATPSSRREPGPRGHYVDQTIMTNELDALRARYASRTPPRRRRHPRRVSASSEAGWSSSRSVRRLAHARDLHPDNCATSASAPPSALRPTPRGRRPHRAAARMST